VRHQAYRTGGGRAGGERAFYCASAPGVALGSPWKFPLHVAWALLGGREGLLDRRLRRERALTYALAAFSRELAEGGYGVCFAECPAGAVDEVAGQVAEAFGELAVGGTEPAALRSARERLIIRQHAAVQAECDLAERLCGYELAGVDPAQYAAYPARIAAVGPAELCAAAAAFLRPD
jgi:predicted Zn-dependent peptidase